MNPKIQMSMNTNSKYYEIMKLGPDMDELCWLFCFFVFDKWWL